MEILLTRVESPLPFIDFDGIWKDAVKRYYRETAHILPDVYESCTATNSTLDFIHKRHPDFPLQFAIPRENGRLFRELLTELLELLHQYAKLVWVDEGESPKAITQFYAALVYFCDVAKDKYIIVGDYLYGLWKLMMRTKPYVEGEIEIETQEELARTLGEILVTVGFANPRIKAGNLTQNNFSMILMDNDYYMVLSHLDSLIFRDDKIKSTGLLLACKESLIALRDTIQNPREEAEVRKAFFDPISVQHNYLRDIGGNLRTSILYNVARRQTWDERNHGNIFAWLGAPDSLTTRNLLKANHAPGTGEWFLQTNEYMQWKTGTSSIMLLNGPYGCGKTYLTYTVIEDLYKQCDDGLTAVAYFYFDIYEISKVTYKQLLTGLLAQLSTDFAEKCSPILQKLYATFDNGKEPPFIQDIIATLKDMLQPFKNVYIIIDGMDEVPEFGEVVGFLRTISQWGWDGLHVFLTGNQDIKEYPELRPLITHQYSIKEEDTRQDIFTYTKHRYETEGPLGKWKEKGLPFLNQYLPKRYEGLFQWVNLQLRSVQKARSSINAMRLFLDEMPQPMDKAYQYLFSNSHPTFHPGLEEDGLRLLPWMGFCARFLDLREYATGVEFSVDQDPPIIDGDYRLGDVEDVLMLFPNVLAKTPDHLYRVSHGSVRQFLLKNPVKFSEKTTAMFDADISHCFIAKGTLAYLLQFNEDGVVKTGTIDRYPLAIYSAHYWFYHVSYGKTAEDPLVHRHLMRLFTPDSPQLRNWVRLYDIDKGPQQIPPQRPHDFNPNALYYASHLGLKGVVKGLLEGEVVPDANVKSVSDVEADAIVKSVGDVKADAIVKSVGDVEVDAIVRGAGDAEADSNVKGVGDADADINIKGAGDAETDSNVKGVGYAEADANVKGVGDSDSDLNVKGPVGDTEVDSDAKGVGDVEEDANVKGVDEADASARIEPVDVNATAGFYGNALQVASVQKHIAVVELLLEHGADVNAQGGFYHTALQAASFSGSKEIAQLLLDKGADVNAQGGYYGNALKAAVKRKNSAIATMLKGAGAKEDV